MDGQETLVGSTLKDKWRLDALIGRGGMAAVYAATHRNGSRVAVKVLHPEFSRNAGVRERFVREGYLANRVGRGAVAALDDDVADDGSAFLVMELLDGETLEDLRERQVGGRLPAAIVVSMVDQVLATLVVAHEQGIVHRDLKPENIFLTRSGEVKLLDFGIARIHEGQEASRATATGAMMGTPSYLPPEQARGRWAEVDARSDVWAVGATMFTLLTGRCVHEGETVPELLLQAMTEAAPTLASVDVDVDAGLASVVDRALSFKKEDRWPDVASMREAFRGLDLPDLHLPPVEPPSTPRVSVSQRDSSAVRGRTTGPGTDPGRGEVPLPPRQPTVVTMSSRTLAPGHALGQARPRRVPSFTAFAAVACLLIGAWILWSHGTPVLVVGAPVGDDGSARRAGSSHQASGPALATSAPLGDVPPAQAVEASPVVTPATSITASIAVSDLPDVVPAAKPPKATGAPSSSASSRPRAAAVDLFTARK